MKSKLFATGGNGPKPLNRPKPNDDDADIPATPDQTPEPVDVPEK